MSLTLQYFANKWSLDSNFPVFWGAKNIINEPTALHCHISVLNKRSIAVYVYDDSEFPLCPLYKHYHLSCTVKRKFQNIIFCRALDKWPTSTFTVTIQILSQLLAYGNSCVNPILYAFLSEPFRRGFCAIVTCIRPAGPHGLQGWVQNSTSWE